MPSSPIRRLLAVLAVGALALTGCGEPSSGGGGSSKDPLSQVTVSGGDDTKAPTIELTKKPFSVEETQSKVLKEGTGAALTDSDITSVNAAIVNGKDGKVIDETWSAQPIGLDLASERTFASLRATLPGLKIGSRVLIASPPKDAFGDQGRDSIGVAPTDSVLFLIDILAATKPLAQAEGSAVAPKKGLPTVEWHPDRAATVTMPKGAKAPTKLVVQKLIQGAGAEVKKGANVRVTYTGVLWDGGKSFDSSMTKDPTWFEFTVGAGQVIPGWDKGLQGAKVGDRLLLVIPPADGYGPQGQPSSTPPIKGTDTLVFVVDVLATY